MKLMILPYLNIDEKNILYNQIYYKLIDYNKFFTNLNKITIKKHKNIY